MVDSVHREAPRGGQGSGRLHADEECPDKPGSLCDSNAIELFGGALSLGECSTNTRNNGIEVLAACKLGHDATEYRVGLNLGGDDAAVDNNAAYNRDGRFVA